MRLALAIGFALALAVASPPASAPAAEPGTDELRAGLCDAFEGLSFVFCVALCEARECDHQPADDARCAQLAHGFARASGGVAPPCATPLVGNI